MLRSMRLAFLLFHLGSSYMAVAHGGCENYSCFVPIESSLETNPTLLGGQREKYNKNLEATSQNGAFYIMCLFGVVAVLAAVHLRAFLFGHFRMLWVIVKSFWSMPERAALAIANYREYQSEIQYVERPADERALNIAFDFDREPDGRYVVLYGVHGSGKSALVRHIVKDKKDVMFFWNGGGLSPQRFYMTIACHLNVHLDARDWLLCECYLIEALRLLRSFDRIPTLVFEIEDDSPSVDTIHCLVKQVAEYAHVCIVVADTGTAMKFRRTERFVCLGEMKLEEALALLARSRHRLSSEEVDLIITKVGTNPCLLRRFINRDNRKVHEAVDAWITRATLDLNAFKFKKLLKMLKNSPSGDVDIDECEDVMDCGVWLTSYETICLSSRNRDGVLFNKTTMKYSLTTVQKTALRTLDL